MEPKIDLTNNTQKLIAAGIIGLMLIIFYFLLPPFIVIMSNLYIAAGLLVPVAFICLYPTFVWDTFKELSWKLTKGMISTNKLGYMYRYHDYLIMRIGRLEKNVTNVTAAKIGLQKMIKETGNRVQKNKSDYISYENAGASKLVLSSLSNKINVDENQLKVFLPQYTSIENNEKYLLELLDYMRVDTEQLKYTIDAKASEFKILEQVAQATGNAKEFLRGSTPEYKIFQESLTQLEESANLYTAKISNFEREAKPIMERMALDKTISEDEGLRLIEEFKASTKQINFKSV